MDRSRVAVIIEDDADVQELIAVVLSQAGFEVHRASSGAEGIKTVREVQPLIVTLDVELGDIDGFEVARQVREFSESYVIMISGRHEEMDAYMGLETGADDYVIKPFRPRELRARVAALLRRPRVHSVSQLHRQPQGRRAADQLEHKGLVVNAKTRQAELKGTQLDLSDAEFDLLHTLLQSMWVPRSNADLAQKIRAGQYETGAPISPAEERAVDYFIIHLRNKIGDTGSRPEWIKSVPGGGYCMVT